MRQVNLCMLMRLQDVLLVGCAVGGFPTSCCSGATTSGGTRGRLRVSRWLAQKTTVPVDEF